jgi:hypothetical protein
MVLILILRKTADIEASGIYGNKCLSRSQTEMFACYLAYLIRVHDDRKANMCEKSNFPGIMDFPLFLKKIRSLSSVCGTHQNF